MRNPYGARFSLYGLFPWSLVLKVVYYGGRGLPSPTAGYRIGRVLRSSFHNLAGVQPSARDEAECSSAKCKHAVCFVWVFQILTNELAVEAKDESRPEVSPSSLTEVAFCDSCTVFSVGVSLAAAAAAAAAAATDAAATVAAATDAVAAAVVVLDVVAR